ncbi:pyruvate carboxyltransferase, partial [Vibrio parahaemolyticus]|nr:pyruvate carboxyltransferase [Vibrio parahaemolyticus]
VFLPKNRFDEDELSKFSNISMIDYSSTIEKDTLVAHKNYCTLPYDNTAAYALCIAFIGQAQKISLVGFDGYDVTDRRQMEMNEIFSMVSQQFGSTSIQALTPTTYPVKAGSIYAPAI